MWNIRPDVVLFLFRQQKFFLWFLKTKICEYLQELKKNKKSALHRTFCCCAFCLKTKMCLYILLLSSCQRRQKGITWIPLLILFCSANVRPLLFCTGRSDNYVHVHVSSLATEHLGSLKKKNKTKQQGRIDKAFKNRTKEGLSNTTPLLEKAKHGSNWSVVTFCILVPQCICHQ